MTKIATSRCGQAALWVFPMLLWLVSTGALVLWDLGKYSDDWAVNLRVSETDAYAWPNSPWERWNYFWRPLHLVTVYGLATAFWHHDWVNHLISALAHLGVAALLWRLLRTLGASAPGTSAAVSVFITFPIAYEAALWPAAIGSVVSVGWFLLIALMCVRLARIERVLTRVESLRWFGALAVMTFLCASWHEQGAACVAALPALMLAGRPVTQTARRVMCRIILAMAACGVGCIAYIALLMATAPRGKRGSGASIIGVEDAGGRVSGVMAQIRDWLQGTKFVDVVIGPSAWTLVEGTRMWQVWVLAAALGIAALAWWWSVWCDRQAALGKGTRTGWLALFAIAVMVVGFVPIAMVKGNFVFSRYFYPFGLGVGVLIAACWMGVLSGSHLLIRWTRAVCAAAVVGVCMVSLTAMVYAQAAFIQRSRADQAIGAELRGLIPNPAPGAVFVPLDLRDRGNTASRGFPQGRVLGALTHPWSSWAFIQRTYGRGDLTATHWRPGARAPITLDERGVTYPRGLADSKGRIAEAPSFVPRERAVVFTVDAKGTVRVLEWDEARGLLGAGRSD